MVMPNLRNTSKKKSDTTQLVWECECGTGMYKSDIKNGRGKESCKDCGAPRPALDFKTLDKYTVAHAKSIVKKLQDIDEANNAGTSQARDSLHHVAGWMGCTRKNDTELLKPYEQEFFYALYQSLT